MRGAVFFVKMPEHKVSHNSCERGYRPVVVVSSNTGNRTSDIAMVCPITTKIKKLSCNVDIAWSMDGRPSQVLCNQIVTIPKSELAYKRGHITLEEQKRVDIAMCISLGINIDYNEVKDYVNKRKHVDGSI